MGVEGQVVGGQGHVRAEQRLQPCLHGRRERTRMELPEQSMVGQQQAGSGLGGALEQLQMGRDAGGHAPGLGRAGNLKPVGAVVVPARGLEQVVEVGHDLADWGHACHCAKAGTAGSIYYSTSASLLPVGEDTRDRL
jgi:hypothetical protein